MKKVLVPLANGCEEMEAVIIIDVLRRAGVDVVAASLNDETVLASRDVKLVADCLWSEIEPENFNMIVLPGGMDGTEALCEHEGVQKTLRDFNSANKQIAAICAAPLALFKAAILADKKFTCYPTIENMMDQTVCRIDEKVVIDGNLTTSQGPGTAFEFALTLVEILTDDETAEKVAEGMLL